MLIQNKKIKFASFTRTGGMPSSHSALITAISLSIGLSQGFDSTGFFIAFVLSIVVIYDARGIRYTVGKHAKLLNQTILKDDKFELNEHIGHSLPEIIVGIVLGASITIYLYIALAI